MGIDGEIKWLMAWDFFLRIFVDPNKSHTQVRNKNLGREGRLLKLKLVESCDPSG